MLRRSVLSSRALSRCSIGSEIRRQCLVRPASGPYGIRSYADVKKPSISDPKVAVLPGSASSATNQPPPPGRVVSSPDGAATSPAPSPVNSTTSNPTIPPTNIPRVPPTPPGGRTQTSIGSSAAAVPPTSNSATVPPTTVSPPPPPPPAPKPRRLVRRLFLTLLFLSIAGFGGGVYYSRINDNFHDFFTEYVPFGEEAVLYFEEREFRKRFPSTNGQKKPRDTGNKVTIPSQSGVSWRVAEGDKGSSAKGSSAVNTGDALRNPQDSKKEEQLKTVEKAKDAAQVTAQKEAPKEAEAPKAPAAAPVKQDSAPVVNAQTAAAPSDTDAVPTPSAPPAPSSSPKSTFRAPEVNEPSVFPPEITSVDPIRINDAEEPVVQDLVKIINDIILVVNADNANARFSTTIGKAKDELTKVGSRIKQLKTTAEKDAEQKVKESHETFDRAAKELVHRIEREMHEQEAHWKEEFEQEREKLQRLYDQKLKAEIDQANQVNEQRLKNELLEQAVEMKRKFVSEVKDHVEQERNSRLGKLSDLASTVHELENLTTNWTSVVDTSLKTQQLHVAVEAVRTTLEKAHTPRPFIRELAALKEIAGDDVVVNAAIASIDPAAYQRGIPGSAQLIDRFRRVAGEVRKASLLPEDAGIASHASSYVLSKLLFKKKGHADGNDVESILTRTESFLEEGNLDEAAREMNSLQGWAKTLSKDWLAEVRRVLEVQQALDVIATEARLQSLRVD